MSSDEAARLLLPDRCSARLPQRTETMSMMMSRVFLEIDTSTTLAYLWRAANIIMASVLAGMALSCLRWSTNRRQKARFVGLSLFCVGLTLGSLERLHDAVSALTMLYTVTLVVCLYGTAGIVRRNTR